MVGAVCAPAAPGGADAPAGGLKPLVDDLGNIDAREVNSIDIGEGITVRVGRYGPYVEAPSEDGGAPQRASIPDDVAPDELTVAKARELFATQGDGDRELGTDPGNSARIVAPLVAAGVLTETTGHARNRLWQSSEVLSALDDFAARAGRRTLD